MKEYFNSKAKLIILKSYKALNEESNALHESLEAGKDTYINLPCIIKSNGYIWEQASLYFQGLLIDECASYDTVKGIAYDLLDYCKFLESSKLKLLYLPEEKSERVTYRYHATLIDRINKRIISASSASNRINRIFKFYDYCFENSIFEQKELKNRTRKMIYKKIRISGERAGVIEHTIKSSDLAIKFSQAQDSYDEILDGGRLHPLNHEEQLIFRDYLFKYGRRNFQLICALGIHTGARLQTICTLRVKDIKNLLINSIPRKYDDTYALTVGGNSGIDTKNNKKIKLYIPKWLVEEIYDYTNTVDWKNRAIGSYYGLNEENYIFISKKHNAYYTSKNEINDRSKSLIESNFEVQKGGTIRKNLKDIINIMIKNKEKIRVFSIHDLRATFGMNLLNFFLRNNINYDFSYHYISTRMGHSSYKTTDQYFRNYRVNQVYENVENYYDEILYSVR